MTTYNNFKIGDLVKAKLGYPYYEGAGFNRLKLNGPFKIHRFSQATPRLDGSKRDVAWFEEIEGLGVYLGALELVSSVSHYENYY